ncbi:MAG TPA: ABC transporter substrate-binding protein [Anaerolineae bacterium]
MCHKRIAILVCASVVAVLLAGCGAGSSSSAAASNAGAPVTSKPNVTTLKLGYFPNITHSQALIGLMRGDFKQALGPEVNIDAKPFNAGPSVIEALFAGQLDIAYIGPNPAINGYVKSNGEALRIISGVTSGGAALIVRSDVVINRAADLAGKKIATPQLGNTQDIALRAYLADNGLKVKEKGGEVEVIPTDNPLILDMFKQGKIDAAWVPEPWATRLIIEAGGRLFLDERDLWPNGEFVSANIIVNTAFLKAHPEQVKAFLQAHVDITLWEQQYPDQAKAIVNAEIKRLTGKALSNDVIDGAWSRQRVTYEPISTSLIKSALAAYKAGYLKSNPDLSNIYDLSLLNQILSAKGLPEVK